MKVVGEPQVRNSRHNDELHVKIDLILPVVEMAFGTIGSPRGEILRADPATRSLHPLAHRIAAMSILTRRILLGVLLVSLATAAYVLRVHEDLHDYEVDYRAGQRLLAGEDLYQEADGHYSYKYAPGAAFLEMPLSVLPWPVAKVIFYSLSILVMFGLLRMAWQLLPGDRPKPGWLMPVTFLVLAKYFAREIDLGQINMLISFLLLLMLGRLVAAAQSDSARSEVVAGLLWGVASTLKPYGLIFLPYFAVTRNWRVLAAGTATFVLLAMAPALFYGMDGNIAQHQAWIMSLFASDAEQLTNPNNTSLIGFFARSTGDLSLSKQLYGASVIALMIVVLVVVLRGRNREHAVVLDGAILMTLMPLISPQGWDYVLLMSALGVMLLIQQQHSFGRVARWVLVGNLVIIGLFISDVVGHAAHALYTDWTLTTVNFLVIVAYLCALRFRSRY